jgi:O-antigen/teichoic acid export membrane protein
MASFKTVLVSGSIWKLIFFASTFALNLAITNKLQASKSGVFYYQLNNLSIAALLLSCGLDSAINYYHATKRLTTSSLLSLSVFWPIGISLLFACLYFFFTRHGIVEASFSIYHVLYLTGVLLATNLAALFYSAHNSKAPNLVPALINVLLLILIAFGIINENWLYKLYFFTPVVTAALLLGLLLQKTAFAPVRHFFHSLRSLMNYSVRVFLANTGVFLLLKIDFILVAALCTPADTGNYIQASKFAQLVFFIPILAAHSLFPAIAEGIAINRNVAVKISALIPIYFWCGVCFCFSIWVCGYWLFPFLYGPTFNKMFGCFLLLSPGVLAYAASFPLTPYFSGTNQNSIITQAACIAIGIMVLLDVLLIPCLLLSGAAIGCSIAYIAYFLQLWATFKQQHPEAAPLRLSLQQARHQLRYLLKSLPLP